MKLTREELLERHKLRSRKNRADGKDKEWALAKPEQYLFHVAKKRSKNNGLEFSITKEDIIIPEYCPVLNVKLSSVRQPFNNREFSPSLDRIDITKGYTKDNIQVISFRANRHKSSMTLADIERLYKYSRRELDAKIDRSRQD
jgi:hypothetical protein